VVPAKDHFVFGVLEREILEKCLRWGRQGSSSMSRKHLVQGILNPGDGSLGNERRSDHSMANFIADELDPRVGVHHWMDEKCTQLRPLDAYARQKIRKPND
jgi:hypothetical protein